MEKAYKNLPKSIVKTVLELTEGFAPEGVSKDEWKRDVLGGWQRTDSTRQFGDMTLNPTVVRLEIERHNKAVGPLQWGAVHGNSAMLASHQFRATPPLTKKLEGYKVNLGRTTKSKKRGFADMDGYCTILEVNPQYGCFKHSWRQKEYWCKKTDIVYMHVTVAFCRLQDTSD